MLSKRAAFALGAACGLALAFGGAGARAADDNTVVFSGWGGNWQKAERTYYFAPFEKATGIKVIDVPDVNLAKIKGMVDAHNVEWDVVQAIGMWIPQKSASGDLWETLDYGAIATDGIPDALKDPHGVGVATFAQILAYNTDAYPAGKRPTSWADYFDTKKFPGKRGMLNEPRYALEIGLMAEGVPMDKLYPLDVERSLKHWDALKNDVLWWQQWPQAPSLLASGELAMSLSSQARILGLLNEEKGAPVAMVWNQGIMTTDFLAVPKGSKHKEAAFKLIAWMLDAQRQADYAKATAVGPSNIKALQLVDEKTRELLPSYHYQKGELVALDNAWWAANLASLTERWNQWKLKN
ncbi:MAG TPA: ABC transporter substrate-binding protein [Stellaceae bacterium]|nr:ABC transporter substrate-binding protein [Stellaceae bacterium]